MTEWLDGWIGAQRVALQRTWTMPHETTLAWTQAANALLLFVECYDALLLVVEQHKPALDLRGTPQSFLCVACECSGRALAANGRTARVDLGMRRTQDALASYLAPKPEYSQPRFLLCERHCPHFPAV